MGQTVRQFLDALDQHSERVPIDELVARMEDLEIGEGDFRCFARFCDESYQRNLMHAGPGYQALILCWKAGQRSPIHDHKGSSCGVRVLSGRMTETLFDRTPDGHIYATGSVTHEVGSVCGSEDADIHQVSNLSAEDELITLHVYSPPLLNMGVYSLQDTEVRAFRDPVFTGFVAGDGI